MLTSNSKNEDAITKALEYLLEIIQPISTHKENPIIRLSIKDFYEDLFKLYAYLGKAATSKHQEQLAKIKKLLVNLCPHGNA